MTIKAGIDDGHGGKDPGAVSGSFIEKDINYRVGQWMGKYFEACGIEPVYTRITDAYLSLSERCRLLNNAGVTFVISTHENAGGGDGFDVYHSVNGGKGKELAENIAQEFLALGQNPHSGNGVKTRLGTNGGDYYTMIGGTNAPAVITEFCFLDNALDRQALDTEDEEKGVARAIVKGACKTFGVAFKDIDAPAPQTTTTQGGVNVNTLELQKLCNRLGIKGKNGQPLDEDGKIGPQTRFAIAELLKRANY